VVHDDSGSPVIVASRARLMPRSCRTGRMYVR
jgi:hypothetical protein